MSRPPSLSAVVALAASAALGCGETAAVVTVGGDLTVPDQVDAICLAVADADPAGGEFAEVYPLTGELAALPQTLVVEPGDAASAVVRVRGMLGGVEVARDQRSFSFSGVSDVDVELRSCRERSAGAPIIAGSFGTPGGARMAASWGRGGTLLVVVAAGMAAALRGDPGGLTELPGAVPAAPAATPTALIPVDADGDCDDDLVLVSDNGLALWRRDGVTFAEAVGAINGGVPGPRAVAAADVDHDADIDLVVGGDDQLVLLRNDGAGRYGADGAAIPGGVATEVSALAFGDVDGDGHVDLAVGQGVDNPFPPRLLFNDASGGGSFEVGTAALPDIALRVRALTFVDADGDGARDLAVAAATSNVRLYVNRGDGRLEDRSFITLPDTSPIEPASIAAAEWSGDCFPDLAIGLAGGAAAPFSWSGGDGGVFADEPLEVATAGDQVLLADLDDDGLPDLVVAGGDVGLTWLRRP